MKEKLKGRGGQLSRSAHLVVQVVEQTAVAHELSDNVDGLAVRADCVELDQLRMPHLLHDRRLAQEVLNLHSAWFQSLDGHLRGAVPDALPHITKLPRAELLAKLDRVPRDLPLVLGVVRQALGLWHIQVLCRRPQLGAEPVAALHVVGDHLIEVLERDTARDVVSPLKMAMVGRAEAVDTSGHSRG